MVKAVLFDFDGTISTLRCGWEKTMRALMLRYLPGQEEKIDGYIDESTGIQTYFQMQWLAQQVAMQGGKARDAWDYKDEYNAALMLDIEKKSRRCCRADFRPGSI